MGKNLNCLVNNAGITKDNLAIRMNLMEWNKVIDLNLASTFLMSKFAIKKKKAKTPDKKGFLEKFGEMFEGFAN